MVGVCCSTDLTTLNTSGATAPPARPRRNTSALGRALALSLALHILGLAIPLEKPLPLSLGTPSPGAASPLQVRFQAGRNTPEIALVTKDMTLATRPSDEPATVSSVTAPPAHASHGGPDAGTAAMAIVERTMPFGEYLTPDQLTRMPRPLWVENLESPAGGKDQLPGSAGEIILELLITEHGRVALTRVIHADVPSAFLTRAMRAFRNASFEPGEVFDRPVKSSIRVVIRLAPGGVELAIPDSRQAPLPPAR